MEVTEKKERKPLRIRRKLVWLLAGVLALVVAFGAGALLSNRSAEPVITSDLISQKLTAISELATVEYHYTNMGKFENQVDFYGWKVPLTKKSFIISYDGSIKAGIDLTKLVVDVNGNTVSVTLPAATILSHEMDESSLQIFDETKNIFNPLQISDYTAFTADQRQAVENKAVANGLLTEASDKARAAVEQLLDLMPGMADYTLTVS